MTCHDYCRNAQHCRLGWNVDRNPERCFENMHWEDMEWDAECMKRGDVNDKDWIEEAERDS